MIATLRSALRRGSHATFRFLGRLTKRFIADACPGRAAALAFSLLFALVPLTAVIISVLNAFGVFGPLVDEAQRMILGQLVPTMESEIVEGISEFSANTRTLGFVGVAVFIVTSVLLLNNVSRSLNAIFRFRSRKGFWAKVSTYTSVLVIGIALLSASFVMGPALEALIRASLGDAASGMTAVQQLLPIAFMFVLLYLMIVLVPSGRVSMASAAIGAAVGAALWEVAKRVFVIWTGSVMRLSVIYGGLAAVPIFLIWLYMTWMIILMAVEVASVHQYRDNPLDGQNESAGVANLQHLVSATMESALLVMRRFCAGEPPVSASEIRASYGRPAAEVVIESLAASGAVLRTDHGLLPSRSIESITVGELLSGLFLKLDGDDAGRQEAGRQRGPAELFDAWRDSLETPISQLL